MKKVYIEPSLEVVQIENFDIICGSGGENESLYNTGDDPEPSQNGGYTGIWGE